ncbi:MAG: sigma-E factor negative regulatory protein RseC [Lentisphaeria bacterium]|jgi:sigma-E factor negative regulatory protein RseC
MLHETGKVVAVDEDGLWVETLKQSVCGQCSAKAGCGQKLLNSLAATSNFTLIKVHFDPLFIEEQWQEGDAVVLGVDEFALVKAAVIAYLLPLLFMLCGAYLGSNIGPWHFSSELPAIAGAVVGLFCGALAVKMHSNLSKKTSCYEAQIISKAETPSALISTIERQLQGS